MTISIKDIKPGDTVTLEHENPDELDDEQREFRIRFVEGEPWVEHERLVIRLALLLESGYFITDHKPKVVLPTEPGIYIESDNSLRITNIWRLSGSGRWICAAGSEYDDRAEEFAPFARLVPENENRAKIAAEVIEWLWLNEELTVGQKLRAEGHFGVS